MIETASIDYRNFQEERFPVIGVYYIFKRFVDKGLCIEYKFDLKEFIKQRKEKIERGLDYEFVSEESMLSYLTRRRIQGIRTNTLDGINFQEISKIIASAHFKEFLERHQWLKAI